MCGRLSFLYWSNSHSSFLDVNLRLKRLQVRSDFFKVSFDASQDSTAVDLCASFLDASEILIGEISLQDECRTERSCNRQPD